MREHGRRWRDAAVGALLVGLVSGALVGRASAQGTGTISGTVARAAGLQPVEAAQVVVEGRNVGAATDARGRFVINGLSGDSVTLVVRRLGFSQTRQVVRVGATNVQLLVSETAVHLDEVVTTGTPGAVQERSLGNSVTNIDAVQELQQSGSPDIGNVLNGRAAGVNITPGSGLVGSGPSINIRGVNTVSLSAQPLLYIDGVRVANDVGSGPQIQGGNVVSRLNDIDPQEIESIQIIKGPAAATIYGTEASNGVIQVITKRGVAGKPVFDFQGRHSEEWFPDQAGRFPTNYSLNPKTGALDTFNGAALADASGLPLFRTAPSDGLTGSVAGGNNQVTYRIGADYDYDNGVDRNNAQRRIAATSNVLYHATPRLDVGSTLYVVHNHVDLGQQNGLSPLFSALYGVKDFFPASGGYYQGPPSIYNAGVFANLQDVSRFTGSATIQHRPTDWFNHRLIVGYDQTNEESQGLTNFMPPDVAQYFDPQTAKGSNFLQQRNIQYTTLDYAGNFVVPVVSSLQSTTTLGAQWYSRHIDSIDVAATGFPGPGVSALSAAALLRTDGDFVTNSTIGFYAQQQFNWRDRLFITGAVRVDNNSAFGTNFKWVTYPKVQGSWVVSDESFWGVKPIDKLQLRAAFGESGTQPQNFAALRTYSSIGTAGGSPGATPNAPGNPNLQPERGEEFEAGFTASVFQRIGIDFTYWSRNTINEILQKNESPSLGFPGLEFFNAGKVYSHGLEAQVTAQIIRSEPVGLDLTFNAATASNEITDLGGLPPQNPAQFLPITYDEQGYPLDAYFGKKVVSAQRIPGGSIATGGLVKTDTTLLCDGGPSVRHRAVPCANAPLVYLGQPVPKFVGSTGLNLTLFRRFQVHGLVDFRTGLQSFDADLFNRCEAFDTCLPWYKPQNYSPLVDASVQNGADLQYIQYFTEDASFAKLREISGTYTFPDQWAHSLGASHMSITVGGRNLHTWTSFKGLDPESRADVTNFFVPYSQAIMPIPSSFFTTVNLTF
ncbi:MAG TPA: TonB-dependent receptor [Gemmatimonadaceae bacterium]|nr:TonB-dependent receptor [Gemmatimonadaceae bacterium]